MGVVLQDGFKIGDFDVLPQQGRISGPDGETRVQPKIVDVLLRLATTPGEVVSRQELHESVWGNVIVTDDALNRCISELRRVFGKRDKQVRYIETVPKRGYRLVPAVTNLDDAAIALRKSAAETEPEPNLPGIDNAVATVAVLPFENLTPAAPNAFLADALPTALHCGMARLNRIQVSSRRSSFALRDSEETAQELGRKLGAQYIVSGSIAEAGDRVRVIAEVDDAEAGLLLWSQRFEVDSKNLLAFEQQLTDAVVGAFGGQRLRAEISRAGEAPASKLDAWGLVQRARAYLVSYQASALKDARKLLAEAVAKDPGYALAQSMYALLIAENVINGLTEHSDDDLVEAHKAATLALQLAPRDPAVLSTSGCALAYCGDHRKALESLRHAVKAAPFDLGAWGYMGWPLAATGNKADLEELLEITERLITSAASHPGVPYWQYHRSVALAGTGDYAGAIDSIEVCLAEQPEFAIGLMHYANVLGEVDRIEDAIDAAAKALQANSALTVQRYAEIIGQLTDQDYVREQRLAGLRKAELLVHR